MKLPFIHRWTRPAKQKTLQLAIWANEHPMALASTAGIAGILLGATVLYLKRRKRR